MYKHWNGNRLNCNTLPALAWHGWGKQRKVHHGVFLHETWIWQWFHGAWLTVHVTSLSLQPFKQRLMDVTLFRLTISFCSWSFLFKCTNNLGSSFTHNLSRGILETKFPTQVSFPCSIFYLSNHFNFSFDAQNLPFIRDCSHVITLPVYCSLQE